jgi:predicted N-acetyltransferase YhbS
MTLQPFDPSDAQHIDALVSIWNSACGPDLAISARIVAFNAQPSPGADQAGRNANQHREPVGFALASILPNDVEAAPANHGWIDAVAVTPTAQRQGIGGDLMAWGESWLREQGGRSVSLGASMHTFTPGLPVELNNLSFFSRCGYGYPPSFDSGITWDVAANLATYRPPRTVREIDGVVRPARPGDEKALLQFLRREFPGHWRYEFEEHIQRGARISDYMVLWTERGIDGSCQLTFEDSHRPVERFFPYRLPRPWGQLGSIGVSEDLRGRGYGAALLDAGLRRLHNNGVNGCVIDWTQITDFYAKFGFEKYRSYHVLVKSLQ